MTKTPLLAIVQLPPPVHGVTVMNEAVVQSPAVRRLFDVDVLPLRFSTSVEGLGRLTPRKVVLAAGAILSLLGRCARKRPRLAYFTLVPVGGAFYRDLFLLAVLRLFRVPLVLHLHGKGVRAAARSSLNRWLYRWVFYDVTVVHLSPRLYPDIAEFVPPARCFFLPNGVPDPGEALVGATRHRGETRVHLVFLSNLQIPKGPIVTLQALIALRKRGIPFRASFVGPWVDGECARQFRDLVQEHGLEDAVSHLGPRYGSERDRLLSDADVLVFPTFSESFPLVILEAMSLGLPVVSTPVGGVPDMVEDGVTGFLVPPRDPEALADRLRTLALHPELRSLMGTRGRERFLERFTMDRFEAGLCSILETASELVARPRLSGRTREAVVDDPATADRPRSRGSWTA